MNSSHDFTRGSISRGFWILAIPMLGAMFLETLFNLVDAMWVGRSGTEALAAVNLSSFPIWMLFAIAGIVTTGANSLVAQKLGELRSKGLTDDSQAQELASLSVGMAAVVGFIQTAAVVVWGRDIIGMMAGSHPDVACLADLGYSYLAFVFLFAPVICLNEAFAAILRAYGDTKTPMIVFSVGFFANLVLDPLFIFGWGPIPRMDVFGAALATNISFVVVLALYIWLLSRGKLAYRLPKKRIVRLDWQAMRRMVVIGFPPSIASVVFSLVYMAISPVVGSFGTEAIAALGIGHRVEGINYAVCYAVSLACVTMIGQNVGARRIDRAERTAWRGIIIAVSVNGLAALCFSLFPREIVSLFANDPVVLDIAQHYLQIMAISQVFSGAATVAEGVFAGAGKTWPPMCVSIPVNVLRIPAAYVGVFTFGVAITGIWWIITLLTIVRGAAIFWLFAAGKWRNHLPCAQVKMAQA